jgi:hypothetical protein
MKDDVLLNEKQRRLEILQGVYKGIKRLE